MIPGVECRLCAGACVVYIVLVQSYSQIFSLTGCGLGVEKRRRKLESGKSRFYGILFSLGKNGDPMEVHHTQFSDTDVARLHWFVILMKTTRTRHVVELQK